MRIVEKKKFAVDSFIPPLYRKVSNCCNRCEVIISNGESSGINLNNHIDKYFVMVAVLLRSSSSHCFCLWSRMFFIVMVSTLF